MDVPQASGFCYINDIVLAILELLKYHHRVLYIGKRQSAQTSIRLCESILSLFSAFSPVQILTCTMAMAWKRHSSHLVRREPGGLIGWALPCLGSDWLCAALPAHTLYPALCRPLPDRVLPQARGGVLPRHGGPG